jgi:RNA polymerase sigma-70 factor (ECF subfamily)
MPGQGDVTRVLADLRGPDRQRAFDRLIDLVYSELSGIARARLRTERPDHSLDASALVHEAYLRLLAGDYPTWNDRQHFFRAAAEAMRRVLIEHARARVRAKRGGKKVQVPLTGLDLAAEPDPTELLALDDAIRRLREQDRRAAEIVELRFFGGLSVEETAQALDVSERTVKREWAVARAWLYDALRGA